MSSYAEIDQSKFPEVTVTFTGVASTDENFEEYLHRLKSLYDSSVDIAIIFDARKASLPAIKHQKQQAKWLSQNEELLKSHCKGTAYVMTNRPVRAILKMIFAITPQPVPYKVCSNMDDAKDWVSTQLSA
ncbi:MAG: STAS/SEC14 domain-containing protein [Cryomorphaceae bacterium]